MSHPDISWRLAAIYRCCVRYGKDKIWAHKRAQSHVSRARGNANALHTINIWFRTNGAGLSHIDNAREAYQKGESYP